MQTLVTGGAGFIGSHLAEALLEQIECDDRRTDRQKQPPLDGERPEQAKCTHHSGQPHQCQWYDAPGPQFGKRDDCDQNSAPDHGRKKGCATVAIVSDGRQQQRSDTYGSDDGQGSPIEKRRRRQPQTQQNGREQQAGGEHHHEQTRIGVKDQIGCCGPRS
ncbi:MAG: NAD-dependent epimerase/dehydratase family protein [Magnetococcales bacterium]|nr:NAD-dependent epimerase/dehydratase family protein [Magnetococcales bacterium]